MDLIASALVTLPDVKKFLTITSSKDDEELKHLINVVSRHCQTFCQREFLKATYTEEKYDGRDLGTLNLKNYPIVTVTELIPYTDATALTEDTHFVVYPEQGQIKLLAGDRFPPSLRGISVTYDAGYDGVANLPEELKYSIELAVAHVYKEQKKESYSVTRQQKGESFSEYIRKMYPDRVTWIWERYQRKVVAG